jgi:hypothetical protein
MKRDWGHAASWAMLAGLEAVWIHAVLACADGRIAAQRWSLKPLLLLLPAAAACRWILDRWPMPRPRRMALTALLGAVAALLAAKALLRPEAALFDGGWLGVLVASLPELIRTPEPGPLVLAAGGLIWGLGTRLAGVAPGFGATLGEFQFGLGILMVLFALEAQWAEAGGSSLPLGIGFVALGLTAVAVALGRERGGWWFGSGRGAWLGLLALGLCLVIVLGLLAVWAVNPHLLGVLVSLLTELGRWVLGWFMKLFQLLDGLMGKPDPVPMGPAMSMPPGEPQPGWVRWLSMPEWVRELGRFLVGLLWAVLFLAALWRVSTQLLGWLRSLGREDGVEVDSLGGAFWEDLSALLLRLLGRLGWVGRLLGLAHGESMEAPEARSVRQVYRQFLRWGAAAGHPRRADQTPWEYLEGLAAAVPQGREAFAAITRQYVTTRYGGHPPTPEELGRIREKWREVGGIRSRKAKGRGGSRAQGETVI